MTNNKGYLQDKDGNALYPNDYDSGWIAISLNSALFKETGATFPCRERRIGNIVYLQGLASSSSAPKDSTVGYVTNKPPKKLYFPLGTSMAEDATGNKAKVLTIDTEGKVVIHGSSITDAWVTFSGISYPVD